LGCATRGVVGGGDAADGADGVEVVGDEGFVGDEEHQAELFQDGDLGYAWDLDCLVRLALYAGSNMVQHTLVHPRGLS
jgi:hypothetical protein